MSEAKCHKKLGVFYASAALQTTPHIMEHTVSLGHDYTLSVISVGFEKLVSILLLKPSVHNSDLNHVEYVFSNVT